VSLQLKSQETQTTDHYENDFEVYVPHYDDIRMVDPEDNRNENSSIYEN